MKSIVSLVFVLVVVVVQAKPLTTSAGNACHQFKPAESNPDLTYVECDLECTLSNKDVLCSFELQFGPPQNDSKSDAKIQLEFTPHLDTTDEYLCVSAGPITLKNLPILDRTNCVQCSVHDNITSTKVECDKLSALKYSPTSMFALEAFLKDKPLTMDNFRNGGVYSFPWTKFAKNIIPNRVEYDVEASSSGVHHSIHTFFH